MAVAFSTGGSGYTRSDFMISDAAIPARVEEAAKADQKEQFSKVLSGIGSSRTLRMPQMLRILRAQAARTMRYLRRKLLQGMRSSKCFAAN